jgi:hypothetical protein
MPFGEGLWCGAAGAAGLFRLGVHLSSAGVVFEHGLDLALRSLFIGLILPGIRRCFQGLFRDPVAGGHVCSEQRLENHVSAFVGSRPSGLGCR